MLAVCRLHVLKSFPTACPSPAPPQPSLHTPPPQCSWNTNSIDTRTVRSAAVGSTLRRRPDLHRVDAYTLAETTSPRILRARRPPCRARGCRRLRTSSGSMHCSRRVLQLVVGEHAASVFHQHHQHLQAAQRDVGQHAPSLATSLAGRWLCASRTHLPACYTPLLRHKLLCVVARDVMRHHLVETGCAADRAACVRSS